MLIAIDVDDVCCDLGNTWINLYNKEFKDDLKKEQITEWDVSKFVTKSAKESVFDLFYKPEIYNDMPQIEDALCGVKFLRHLEFEIVFMTAPTYNTMDAKFGWLKRNGFTNNINEYIACKRKDIVMSDYLIDDKFDNVYKTKSIGILFDQPWNRSHNWVFRANGWRGIISYFKNKYGVKV